MKIFIIVFLVFLLSKVDADGAEVWDGPPYARNVIHPDLKCGNENKERRFIIFGDKTSAGMGNMLLFWPAVWSFAKIQNREIILLDGTHPHHICQTQPNCKLRVVKDVPKNDTEFWAAFGKITSWDPRDEKQPAIRAFEMFKFAGNELKLDDKMVKVSGFQDKSNWFTINRNTSLCISKLTGCPLWDSNCVTTKSFEGFFPMPFAQELLDHSKLSGDEDRIMAAFDPNTRIKDYYPQQKVGGKSSAGAGAGLESRSKGFDLGIHLRIQFHLFENHTDPNSPEFMRIEQEYLQQNKTKGILAHTIAWIVKNIERNNSIYIAADNEAVKRALASQLEELGFIVTSSHTGGIKHSARLREADPNLFYAIFDWFALATSSRIMAYRTLPPEMCQRLVSSFALSAQRFNRPKSVILCDPENKKLSNVWHVFPP